MFIMVNIDMSSCLVKHSVCVISFLVSLLWTIKALTSPASKKDASTQTDQNDEEEEDYIEIN